MHPLESKEVLVAIRRIVRSGVVSVVAATAIGGAVLPASAVLEGPVDVVDGSDHHPGEMVDYPLTFPVPYSTWYQDWYWAARSAGIHHGQDLFAAKGAPVLAAADGTIVRVNSSSVSAIEDPDGCCSLVIDHDDGWSTVYVHLDNDTPGTDDGRGWGLAPGIDIGAKVAAGQVVGYVGDSESAEETSPHLHFELRDPEGVIVNPYDTLRVAQGRLVCRVAEPGRLDDLIGSKGLLRLGLRGAAVSQLQRLALVLGHDPGPIDGVFGPRTETAARALQADLRVSADGVVGDETRSAVAGAARILEHGSVLLPEGRLMRWGDVGEDVADLQALLSLAGHDPGAVDGIFRSRTRSAGESLQNQLGVAADGVIGKDTRAALGRQLGFAPLLACSG
jgi:peptidoglycan hydrolase-like protein with peptidoglycan-binding domain